MREGSHSWLGSLSTFSTSIHAAHNANDRAKIRSVQAKILQFLRWWLLSVLQNNKPRCMSSHEKWKSRVGHMPRHRLSWATQEGHHTPKVFVWVSQMSHAPNAFVHYLTFILRDSASRPTCPGAVSPKCVSCYRFDDEGKGKGKSGRVDEANTSGYVGDYKGEGTYDKTHWTPLAFAPSRPALSTVHQSMLIQMYANAASCCSCLPISCKSVHVRIL